jgi:phosphoglycolate phosphatase-like HAD superfamily hydrolase
MSYRYKTLIFDLGSVLFAWKPAENFKLPSKLMKAIFSSKPWLEYECGKPTASVYEELAKQFHLTTADIANAVSHYTDSVNIDATISSLIGELKATCPDLSVFAMSNIPQPIYEVLLSKQLKWPPFDAVFTSSNAGMRKPDLGFYRHVLSRITAPPAEVIFIDDMLENILSAQSIGMHGVHFTDSLELTRQLKLLMFDPIQRGNRFLRQNARNLHSMTETGVPIQDNFAQLLILEATGNQELVSIERHERTWNFFIGIV